MLDQNYQMMLKDLAVQCPQNIHMLSNCTIHHTPGCVYADSNLNHPLLNGVIGCTLQDTQVDQAVATITAHYRDNKLPHSWWVETSQEPSNLETALQKHGLNRIGELYGMSLSTNAISPIACPEELTVKKIDNITEFSQLICSVWGFSDQDIHLYTELMKNGPFIHFGGFINNQLVATSSLLIHNNAAFVYNTVTAEKHRKKGIATFITNILLQETKKQEIPFVSLTSSPEGLGICKRVGFHEVCRFHVYA